MTMMVLDINMVVHSKPKGNTFELMFASQFFAKILSKGDNFRK